MAEPISTTATPSLVFLGGLAMFTGIDAATVLGAFAGASVFVVSVEHLSRGKRAAFFVVSMIAGCLVAQMVAKAASRWLPSEIEVTAGVGAILGAALSVKLLLWMIHLADDPASLFRKFKGAAK